MGYAKANSTVFSTDSESNSLLTKAMDVARGGRFEKIPKAYPKNAWYTYKDTTCAYPCMATEYIYWGVNAWVGALVGRKTNIDKEWRFETREKLVNGDGNFSGDALMTALIKVNIVKSG